MRSFTIHVRRLGLWINIALIFLVFPFYAFSEENEGFAKIPKLNRQVSDSQCPQCREISDEITIKKIDRDKFKKRAEEAAKLQKEAEMKNRSEVSYMAETGRYEQMVKKANAQIEALEKELENCRKQCGKNPAPPNPPVAPPPKPGDDSDNGPAESYICPNCRDIEKEYQETRKKLQEALQFQRKYDAECEERLTNYWDRDAKIKELQDRQKNYKKGSIEEHVVEVQIEGMKKEQAELGSQILGDEERRFRVIKEIERLRQLLDQLDYEWYDCVWGCWQMSEACPDTPFQPVKIGDRSKFGSGASSAAKDVAKSVLGGLVGGLFGGGGGGSSPGSMSGPADSPPLDSNPFNEMKKFTDPGTGTVLAIAGKKTDKGFLMATGIDNGKGNPTIHSMTLHRDNDCAIMFPAEYHLYQLWGKWWLSVSWTRTTYVNDHMTSKTSGGWSSSGTIPASVFAPGGKDSIWQALGFDRATGGPRTVGADYIAPQGQPPKFPDKAVVHVTRPDIDPVTTTPFIFKVTEQPGGAMGFQQIMPGIK